MRLFVPDASVILKWVLREEGPDSEAALRLFHDFSTGLVDFFLPPLWFYEVANVLSLKIGPADALRILHFLIEQKFLICELSWPSVQRTCEMVGDLKVSFYDACYHALAIQEGAQFITADERYYRKSRTCGSILLLADYTPEP